MNQTNEVGFADKFKAAIAVVEEVKALRITSPQEYALAGAKEDAIRGMEKELEAEYKTHPIIIQAKNLQSLKGDLAKLLEDARKSIKNKRIAYDEEQERIRREEERKLQSEARRLADEEKLKAALAAEKAGNKQAAEAIIQQEVIVPTVIIPKDTPKAGSTTRTIWEAVVDDASLIPQEFKVPDMVRLNARARADKENFNIPGCRAVSKKV